MQEQEAPQPAELVLLGTVVVMEDYQYCLEVLRMPSVEAEDPLQDIHLMGIVEKQPLEMSIKDLCRGGQHLLEELVVVMEVFKVTDVQILMLWLQVVLLVVAAEEVVVIMKEEVVPVLVLREE